MIKKQGYRTMPIVERSRDDIEQSPALPSWMKDFAKNLEKTSVQPYRDESIFDQISSVMNGTKPKYSNVEDAVRDMQERSGLSAYKNKVEAQGKTQKKAQHAQPTEQTQQADVNLFKLKPQIKDTFDNYIEDTNGNLSIPSIVEKIKSIHQNDISDDSSWDDESLLKYINTKNIEVKKKHPNTEENNANLGKLPHFDERDIDPSNSDALFSLTPAIIKD